MAAGGKPVRGADPVALLKAVKNPTEINGTRTAHRRDAAALARFLAWIDREAPSGALTEIDTVEALESFRRDTGALKDVSFPTIAGTGPNGAIVHYRVTRKSNRRIVPGDLLLIDSGAQYEDGTTDVTRTIAIGEPTRGDARPFHPRAARPYRDRDRGVSRRHHRRAARLAGAAIPVAGRASISTTAPATASAAICRCMKARRGSPSSAPRALKRGMILSNEPGYYKTDGFGIRIENLELVVAAEIDGAEKPMNGFETLTLAPIDRRLIDVAMLSEQELRWLNDYHARVRREVRPLLDEATKVWLDAATEPLAPAALQACLLRVPKTPWPHAETALFALQDKTKVPLILI